MDVNELKYDARGGGRIDSNQEEIVKVSFLARLRTCA
jgi:hypothetical protein